MSLLPAGNTMGKGGRDGGLGDTEVRSTLTDSWVKLKGSSKEGS